MKTDRRRQQTDGGAEGGDKDGETTRGSAFTRLDFMAISGRPPPPSASQLVTMRAGRGRGEEEELVEEVGEVEEEVEEEEKVEEDEEVGEEREVKEVE